MKASYRQIWLWGSKKSVVYYDSGNVFPFDVVPGSFVDQGTCAANSPVRLDNSVMWIGQDDRGARMAWRASGYTPQRISNHAVEWHWQQYATASDAISYGFQLNGHSFWHIYFPTANASWRYDCATGMWAEVTSLFNGTFGAHLSQNHVYCFNKHLVGDWSSGNIYEMSDAYLDDAGQPIQRMRRAPHISTEMTWTFHQMMQVHLETGVVPQPLYDGNGNPREPQIMLRWSDDGGHTWSNEHWEGAGFGGEYRKRVYWYRLGRSRDRIYEITVTDSIAWRIVDSFLRAVNSEGKEVMAPQQRLNKRLAEMA